MSVSKWAYSPEKCDGDYCVGDCDFCPKADDDGEEVTVEDIVRSVRCKDCRYWSDTICERFEEERIMFMDDYCSYGERREP